MNLEGVIDDRGFHRCRVNEANQFVYLFLELGSAPTHLFISSILPAISQNFFEGERVEQFQFFSKSMEKFCQQLRSRELDAKYHGGKPISDKVEKLLQLLHSKSGVQVDSKGHHLTVIFVERIVTAGALTCFLNQADFMLRCESFVSAGTKTKFKYKKTSRALKIPVCTFVSSS